MTSPPLHNWYSREDEAGKPCRSWLNLRTKLFFFVEDFDWITDGSPTAYSAPVDTHSFAQDDSIITGPAVLNRWRTRLSAQLIRCYWSTNSNNDIQITSHISNSFFTRALNHMSAGVYSNSFWISAVQNMRFNHVSQVLNSFDAGRIFCARKVIELGQHLRHRNKSTALCPF